MTVEYIFIAVGFIIVFIFIYNKVFDTKQFISDLSPFFSKLVEEDYYFLLKIKYGDSEYDLNTLFKIRVRNAIITFIIGMFFLLVLNQIKWYYILGIIVLAGFVYKQQYFQLKSFYKARLHTISLLLPYYLKSLEILVEHYTVPVALSKSIETAPPAFREGLQKLVEKIDAGDSSIQPYLDFAHEYPVRDSMRMMRLLYRLSLGNQAEKHEQIMQFSRTVSSLQAKAREIKYADRLEHIERQTMLMLLGTGGAVMGILFISMSILMQSY